MKFQLHKINSRFCEEDNETDRDAGNFLGAPRGRSDTGCNDYDRAEKVMAFLLFRAAATTCGIVVFEWGSAPRRSLDPQDATRTGHNLVAIMLQPVDLSLNNVSDLRLTCQDPFSGFR